MSTIGPKVNFLLHSLKHIRRHFLNCSGDTISKLSKISRHWWTIHFIFNETPKKINSSVKAAILNYTHLAFTVVKFSIKQTFTFLPLK
ncbi:hypothetical protein C0J52_04348 [Blattella germanica]|nr:hypothetical protein C0J52_04348 [Blattella germanica]